MVLHRRHSSLAFVLTLLVWRAVQAGEPETADQLVAKGVEFRKKGDHAAALREFQAAHAIEPSGRTLGQMGIAEATLQRWVDAEDHLAQALDSPTPWVQKNRATLEDTLQTVRTHTAEVSILGPAGAFVMLGDKPVGQIPLPTIPRVNEGLVTIKVEMPGQKPFVQTISARGGARLIVTAWLEPLSSDAPPAPAAPLSGAATSSVSRDSAAGAGPSRRWTGIGLLTLGVVAVTWGIVWIAVDGKDSWSNSDLVWNTRTPGWFIAGGGVVAALGGGYLLYSSSSSDLQVAAIPTGLMGRF